MTRTKAQTRDWRLGLIETVALSGVPSKLFTAAEMTLILCNSTDPDTIVESIIEIFTDRHLGGERVQ